ncbi:zinc finger, zz type domain-containing protein [Toxoplasma gondii TgCatPRC2]|uniref:Zinc finger, zz type domain-containing protein n=2 Tax=Toxoplasma gondii TaxID=5811 RepID=A0A151HCY3_TOXGO|nr:zinc finger, zz type domain-containing protein [Toxoplasma gondii ME49]EPT24632.1 zinc finger, zz type domain-containing protein [Toxoplasma gondii ME49]KYK67154.1 zinc finger, zz type domain-containing protein [Toxoplasma gondii TgCatPRC2]|eukprot:XP_018634813.1 zinc finger, zz type domain-containing protein [Toxoplasma gondii ME49]
MEKKKKRHHPDGFDQDVADMGTSKHEEGCASAMKSRSKSEGASDSSHGKPRKKEKKRTKLAEEGDSFGDECSSAVNGKTETTQVSVDEKTTGKLSRHAAKKFKGVPHKNNKSRLLEMNVGCHEEKESDEDDGDKKRDTTGHASVKGRKRKTDADDSTGDEAVTCEANGGSHELFASESDGDSETRSGTKSKDIDRIAINKAYAEAYEVRKRREMLSKNKELLDDSDESESSSDEDEDGELLSERVESKILDTLARIKNKDPSVYDKDYRFFGDDDFEDDEDAEATKGSDKKTTYKDLVRRTLEERGPTAFIDEEDALSAKKKESQALSYHDELAELKKAFVDAAEGVEEGGAFLQKKEKTEDELAQEAKDYKKFLSSKKGKEHVDMTTVLNHYWAPDENLDPDERFLRDYILNQGWREDRAVLQDDQPNQKFDEEEDELNIDQTDAFEAAYNFRFEEEGGSTIQGHARRVEGSVRQKNDKRRRQREAKKARLAEEKAQREEELRRLKAMKKQEILERIQKIQEMTGHQELDVTAIDLDADFDPEAHDKEMATMLGDDYEQCEENVPEEELLKVPAGFEEDLGVAGEDDQTLQSLSKKQRKLMKLLKKRNARALADDVAYAPLAEDEERVDTGLNNESADAHVEGNDSQPPELLEQGPSEWWMCDSCGNGIPGGKKRFDCMSCENYTLCKHCFRNVRHPHQLVKRTVPKDCQPPKDFEPGSPEVSKTIKEYLDEYFQTDYEDIIGKDLPTRFKYTSVKPESYGLTVEDILSKTDKELNAHISLKKLAPYRPQVHESRRKLQRAMFMKKRNDKGARHGGRKEKNNTMEQMTKFGITRGRLDAYGD